VLYWLLVPSATSSSSSTSSATSRAHGRGRHHRLVLSFLLGPRLVRSSRASRSARRSGPTARRAITPRRDAVDGRLIIILCTVAPTLLWGNLGNAYVWVAMGSMILFGLVGLVDDVLKVRRKQSLGLRPGKRSPCRSPWRRRSGSSSSGWARAAVQLYLSFPFFKQWIPFLGWLYLPWIVFILVGSSNAVNLADGLDGLAIGLTLISVTALTALTYVAGHANWSTYLNIPR